MNFDSAAQIILLLLVIVLLLNLSRGTLGQWMRAKFIGGTATPAAAPAKK